MGSLGNAFNPTEVAAFLARARRALGGDYNGTAVQIGGGVFIKMWYRGRNQLNTC